MGPTGCENSFPTPVTPQECWPISPAFTFAPPSLPPILSGPMQLEGASVGRGSGPGSQQAPWDPSGQGKCLPPPFWSSALPMLPLFPPLGMGTLTLPQLPFSGTGPIPPPLLLPTHFPPHPTWSLGFPPIPLGVHGPPSVTGWFPSCAETRTPRPPSLPS